jgi:hypothetical protein
MHFDLYGYLGIKNHNVICLCFEKLKLSFLERIIFRNGGNCFQTRDFAGAGGAPYAYTRYMRYVARSCSFCYSVNNARNFYNNKKK